MLPKKERLKKVDFLNLKPKMVFRGTYVDVAVSPQKELKFSCIISKKRIKKAVERNKARRKVYAIVQEVRPKKPYFVIIYPKHTVLNSSYPHIKTEISTLFDTL